jgi:hypothetical protein
MAQQALFHHLAAPVRGLSVTICDMMLRVTIVAQYDAHSLIGAGRKRLATLLF